MERTRVVDQNAIGPFGRLEQAGPNRGKTTFVDQNAIRIKSNAVLEPEIEHLLTRPVARPPHKLKGSYHSFPYPAKSWQRARPLVAKIECHARELSPRGGFIVADRTRTERSATLSNLRSGKSFYEALDTERDATLR